MFFSISRAGVRQPRRISWPHVAKVVVEVISTTCQETPLPLTSDALQSDLLDVCGCALPTRGVVIVLDEVDDVLHGEHAYGA
jgi:hypothetical protein